MESRLRVIIIDDESHSRERIKLLLSEDDDIVIIDDCSNGKQAINSINKFSPDLVFLDIRLKDMTGFDILKGINPVPFPTIIFVTAYDEYALHAFNFFALDYLLKPFEESRFRLSLNRAKQYINSNKLALNQNKVNKLLDYINKQSENKLEDERKLPMRVGPKIEFIDQDTIKYIEASGYYVEIHTIEKKYLHRESLTNLASKLNSGFTRIHRSAIISNNHIKELEMTSNGGILVIMIDGAKFKVSKSYKKLFQDTFRL